MPPEQAKDGIVLPRSDVYSLGRTLNEIFPEAIPDGGITLTNPVAKSPLDWELASKLGALFSRMTRPEPSDRPAMPAVVDRLRSLLDLPFVR